MYNFLARLDKSGCDLIVVEAVPDNSEWLAVKDRLIKAKVSDTVLESIFNKKINLRIILKLKIFSILIL